MATLVIGDLQGHLEPLVWLLARAGWDAARDRLIAVGDLVNRGPDSPGVLRFLRGLGDRVVATLGNHDIYALGRHAGVVAAGPDDTLGPLLAAPDADELLTWLRSPPHCWPATVGARCSARISVGHDMRGAPTTRPQRARLRRSAR
jgi:bis(5'-nucleosyl)-tetraphosphatase (symmetrical)